MCHNPEESKKLEVGLLGQKDPKVKISGQKIVFVLSPRILHNDPKWNCTNHSPELNSGPCNTIYQNQQSWQIHQKHSVTLFGKLPFLIWFLFRWFYPSLYFKLWQSTTNFEAEHKKWINKENQVVHLWQKWQMFAVCWVSPLMDSSAAALFVASTKTQKLHNASSCICRICASSIILDFKKHQLVFHPQYPQVWF